MNPGGSNQGSNQGVFPPQTGSNQDINMQDAGVGGGWAINFGMDPAFKGSLDGSFLPTRTESDFEKSTATADATLTLPPITESALDPVKKCNETCADLKKNIRKECNILRKRVQEALKEKGCPSRVSAYASRKTTCCTPKKKTTTKKRNCGC